jgi:large subunit ribosomal protein L2
MKKYKPTTPGRRGMTSVDYSELTSSKPEKSLLKKISKHSGRNSRGRITVRHQGGGYKKKYRLIDFKRIDKAGIPAKVATIEYDPNRSCFIALLHYQDGEKRYILAPAKLKIGSQVICQEKTPLKIGNRMKIKNMPIGSQIYNIELFPKKGGQVVRSAGSSAEILAQESIYTHVKFPSNEVRAINKECWASLGELSNSGHNSVVIGKAGRKRWMGIRPTVRGSAMNPCDHPHGGGENRQPIGLRKGPKTPWGKLAYGVKTRKKKKASDRLIIKKRSKKRR